MKTKKCNCCGKEYSKEEWDKLPYVGIQYSDEHEYLELRNCSCKDTMAIWLPHQKLEQK
jgi:hypothetical protein